MKFKLFIGTLFLGFSTIIYAENIDSVLIQNNLDTIQPNNIVSEESLFIQKLDKMMDTWFEKQNQAKIQSLSSLGDCDSAYIPQDADSLIALRLSRLETVIPVTLNEKTKAFIELYVYKRKASASYILAKAQCYFPKMQQIFDKHNVPEELIYLTIIESALDPKAVSSAGATGIWQFMYNTGKMYGLDVNTFIDDRRDPMKATEAAAMHLKDLYHIFGDWSMVIAAYNCGAGNVRKAIQRSGGKTGFWNIYPYLPAETRNYFPAYCGALYMMKYYKMYDIKPNKLSLPLNTDTIMVTKEVHFEQISKVLGINIEEIQALNPQYKRNVIPAYVNAYPLTLPHQFLLKYIEMKDSIHAYHYNEYFTPLVVYENILKGNNLTNDTNYNKKYHVVKRGESLSKIAVKYGLSIKELQKMNCLTSTHVSVGTRLTVGYASKNQTSTTSESPKSSSSSVEYYKVKSGDTLGKIASKYHTSLQKIIKDNKISNPNAIKIGQTIKIIL